MSTPAGWYTDPTDPHSYRWWDGERWTEHLAPADTIATPTDYAAPLATAPAAGSRSALRMVTGGALALLVGVAGLFAFTQLTGASGGADTPEGAVEALFAAIADEDLAGAADLLLPGERRTLAEPLLETLDELARLRVLSDAFDSTSIGGIDLGFSDLVVTSTPVTDDLANVYASGTASASIDGRELPIGDRIVDLLGEVGTVQEGPEITTFDNLRLTTVREDGRWYVSLMYTAGEAARLSAGVLPISEADGIQPLGGSSPDDAIDLVVEAVNDLSARDLVAMLNPDEAAALQRYASLFIDDWQRGLDDSGTAVTLTDLEYSIDERGDTALVTIDGFTASVSFDDPESGPTTVIMTVRDGCLTIDVPESAWDGQLGPDDNPFVDVPGFEVDGDVVTYCPDDTASEQFDMPPFPLDDLAVQNGLLLVRTDGRWYLSPLANITDMYLSVLRALDDDTIDAIGTWFENLMGSAMFGFDEGADDDQLFMWLDEPAE